MVCMYLKLFVCKRLYSVSPVRQLDSRRSWNDGIVGRRGSRMVGGIDGCDLYWDVTGEGMSNLEGW